MGDDDTLVRRQGRGALDRLKPLGDALRTANMMLTQEALKCRTSGELSRFERRPLTEKVTKESGLLIRTPLDSGRNFPGND